MFGIRTLRGEGGKDVCSLQLGQQARVVVNTNDNLIELYVSYQTDIYILELFFNFQALAVYTCFTTLVKFLAEYMDIFFV